jgi:putative ATPase
VSAGKDDIRKIIAAKTSPHSSLSDEAQTSESKTNPSLVRRGSKQVSSQDELIPASVPPLNKGRLEGVKNNITKVLFLDEIHRFNKAQQDFLLPYVERGELVLIGATTENPSFEVIAPLLSRLRVFVLEELSNDDMALIIDRTGYKLDPEAKQWLIEMANGDARAAITMVENTGELYQVITVETLKNTLQSKFLRYDKKGEEHYNTISAYIKSMRASQPDAALYYLARMIEAGEDPKFIARRMVIFASEDIGMAQPTALVVANEVFRAVETIGLPEAAINLAHGTVYMAECKKDKGSYNAYFEALADVQKYGNLPVPLKIRNAPTKLMKNLGYGEGYEKYTNDDLLPEKLKGKTYYKRINKKI